MEPVTNFDPEYQQLFTESMLAFKRVNDIRFLTNIMSNSLQGKNRISRYFAIHHLPERERFLRVATNPKTCLGSSGRFANEYRSDPKKVLIIGAVALIALCSYVLFLRQASHLGRDL